MGNLGWPEILIILVIVVVLFGSKRLPDLARSVGRSMRIFKSEVKEMTNEEAGFPTQSAQTPELPQGQPQPVQPQQFYQQPATQQPAQPQQMYQQPAQPQQGYHAGNYNPPANPAN